MFNSIQNSFTEYIVGFWMVRSVKFFLIPAVVFLISSCSSSSGPDGINYGSFEAEVSGHINESFSGLALFGVQQLGEPTGNIFVLSMAQTASNRTLSISTSFASPNRPVTGSFTLGNLDSGRSASFIILQGGEEMAFFSVSGDLTITRSSSDRLEGEISFRAVNVHNASEEVNVVSRFNARCMQSGEVVACD